MVTSLSLVLHTTYSSELSFAAVDTGEMQARSVGGYAEEKHVIPAERTSGHSVVCSLEK